jgi:DNA polymerase-3 subunit epsilon
MREIIIDTETTGLDPLSGDRIIEIAAIELIDGALSDNTFHRYVNPERDVPDSATKVHGITYNMLENKPKFYEIAKDFLEFLANDQIVAHNAEFDLKFINCELDRAGLPRLSNNSVVDTLGLARKKHPGSSNSLDALCTRYRLDRSRRVKHGALIDAEILAEVYIELRGGRQTLLSLELVKETRKISVKGTLGERLGLAPSILDTGSDENRERRIIDVFGVGGLWRRYLDSDHIMRGCS